MDIPHEIYEAMDNKFDKYNIVNCWEVDDVYYLCIYSKKCFYFLRVQLGQGYPYRSVFINLDNRVTLADIKKEMKKDKLNEKVDLS